MRFSRDSIFFAIALTTAVMSAGCSAPSMYDPKVRRERLLAIYPPGQTNRTDVQAKWAPLNPEFTAVRPVEGWATLGDQRVRERITASEQRTGQAIQRVDCYVGADSRSSIDFWGLCRCWFYYDAADDVIDVEWQYHTD